MIRPLSEHVPGCQCARHEALRATQALLGNRDKDADLAISIVAPQPPLIGKARRAAEKEARAIAHDELMRKQALRAARNRRRKERKRTAQPQRVPDEFELDDEPMAPDASGHFWVWSTQ